MESTTVVDAKSRIIYATSKLVIKNMVEVMTGFRPGERIESENFLVGEVPLAIQVYPNGCTEESEGSVSIYLRNNGDAELRVKFTLIADIANRELFVDYCALPVNGANGALKFLTHAECADFYKEKDFVITAKVETPGKFVRTFRGALGGTGGPDAKMPRYNILEGVYEKMEDTTFTLIFNGEEVPCHKHILAAASPVLEAMVKNKHREAIECRVGENAFKSAKIAGRHLALLQIVIKILNISYSRPIWWISLRRLDVPLCASSTPHYALSIILGVGY